MKVRITSVRNRPNTKEFLIGYQINDNGSVGYLTYSYISLQRIINNNNNIDNIMVIITSYIKIKEEEKEKRNEEKASVEAVLKFLVGQEIEV